MKPFNLLVVAACAAFFSIPTGAAEASFESAPPVVVKTVPPAGAEAADPALTQIRVTFSKPMSDGSWSWSTWGENTFPETTGKPYYEADGRTCVLPVKLAAGRFYAMWVNSDQFTNFKDQNGEAAVPYLLTFKTAGGSAPAAQKAAVNLAPQVPDTLLNDDQKLVLTWTEKQFRSFFDQRSFDVWSEKERAELETKLIDSLKGPQNRDYYLAINTLAALHSRKAVPALLEIAVERREKDCRDRWMATRALGIIGDKSVVPELIHLVYHGNLNTRWTAQIALVQLTGKNFGNDWEAWGKWWTAQGGKPEFKPEFVQWYKEPEFAHPAAARTQLAKSDAKFLQDLKSR